MEGSSPRSVSSKRTVKYRGSSWRVHEFRVGGEMGWRAAAVGMAGSLLVWVGEREPCFSELALATWDTGHATASPLLGGAESASAATARRLASALRRPVFAAVCTPLDRFSALALERNLITEIKSRPDLLLP